MGGKRPRRTSTFGATDSHNRIRIAQAAARLIAEHGITDWSLAKRKAARQLMLPEREPLPGDDEVQAALAEHHALFAGDAHEAQIRKQREVALRWMQRLAQFSPALTGGVAEGWATEHSDIRLELVASDAKLVELALLNAGEPYRAMGSDRDGGTELYLDNGVRLSVRARRVSRRAEIRLSTEEVVSLLGERAGG